MKKNFKLVLALVLSIMMVLGSMSALADELPTYTVNLTTLEGHTYEVFQIFTGKVDADGHTFTELKYGQNGKGTEGNFLSKEDLAALKALADRNLTDEHTIIEEYSKFVNFTNPKTTVQPGTTSNVQLPSGYYIIRDVNNQVPSGKDNDSVTLYMFTVLNQNVNTSTKSGTVESEKHVDDQNDSDAEDHSELKDSADYDIGDEIPYTLTFKLPENYAKYEKYYVQFSDTMSKGLTLITDSVKIKYGSADAVTTTFTAGTVDADGNQPYTLEIEDLKVTAPTMAAGDVITITYKAYLNDQAVTGTAGNPNTYTVKFNNNPNDSGKGKPTGDTPEDKNIVFTYKTIFDKVDENGEALEGADFTLQKKMADGSYVDVTTLGGQGDKHPAKTGSSASKSTTFSFTGLDAGDYKLIESYTPAGYNKISDIEFTITATHDLVSNDPKLTDLTSTGLTMEKDLAAGSLKTSIENKSGAVLPSTGGIGTTIFYVAGSLMVLAAAILLITKRRMGAED